jgi:diguanylate cyclase (GGDEF)-like protein
VASPSSILLVDDDPTSIALLRQTLSELGQLRFATSGTDALRVARQRIPDLVLLDVEMPGMTGFEVCAAMKQDELLRDVPIIFITSHDELEQEVTGLSLGAADFIGKPLRAPLVIARVRTQLAMKAMADALRQAATTDVLTGLANRRSLDERMDSEWSRCHRSGLPLSLLLIDVDCFKTYNDRYGHQAGDDCLAAVATAMREAVCRAADLCARYGGEEFCVLLPDTPRHGAWEVAQRIRAAIDALQRPHDSSSVAGHVTVSIGVTTYHAAPHEPHRDGTHAIPRTPRELIAAADQALYAAKRAGRHRALFLDFSEEASPVDLDIAYDQRPTRPALELRR